MDKIKAKLVQNRPTITNSSVNTYASLLKSLYLKSHDSIDDVDLDWFKDENAVLKALEEKPSNCRKTILAAVIVLNGKDTDNKKLTKQMNDDSSEYAKFIQTQKKTEKQKENWMDHEEVKNIEKKMYEEISPLLNSRKALEDYQRNKLNKWMACVVSAGIYFPPRRSEWVSVKLEDIDKEKDNYIDLKANEFVLNRYKTVRTYGTERLKYPADFAVLLKKYLNKVKGQKYFIEYGRNNVPKPLTPSAYTLLLNEVYGKKIGTSMLRHIYLSSLYENIPQLEKMKQTASSMGHDLVTALEYVKH